MINANSDQLEYVTGILRFTEKQILANTGLRIKLECVKFQEPDYPARRMFQLIVSELGYDILDICGPSRKREFVCLRIICADILRKHYPKMTLKEIGAMLGGRDHSSIVHYFNEARNMESTENEHYLKMKENATQVFNKHYIQKEVTHEA